MFEINGQCATVQQLAIANGVKAASLRIAEVFTSRMSRATAERLVARLEGPITRVANKLGWEAKVAVHNAHHYFPRYAQSAEHIQINVWKAGVKQSGRVIRFVINLWP